MAFCPRGSCKFTKKSKTGLPQCSVCGRVDISAKNKGSSRSRSAPKKRRERKSVPKSSGYRPTGAHRLKLKGIDPQ